MNDQLISKQNNNRRRPRKRTSSSEKMQSSEEGTSKKFGKEARAEGRKELAAGGRRRRSAIHKRDGSKVVFNVGGDRGARIHNAMPCIEGFPQLETRSLLLLVPRRSRSRWSSKAGTLARSNTSRYSAVLYRAPQASPPYGDTRTLEIVSPAHSKSGDESFVESYQNPARAFSPLVTMIYSIAKSAPRSFMANLALDRNGDPLDIALYNSITLNNRPD